MAPTSIRSFAASIGVPRGTGIAAFSGLKDPASGPVSLRLLARHGRTAIRVLWEPRPDARSGDGTGRPDSDDLPLPEILCLGECLELGFSLDPLFRRDGTGSTTVAEDEYLSLRQGALKNCPLVACLVAMARSPGYGRRILDMVREVQSAMVSARLPASYESCVLREKTARCVKGRPPRPEGYSSDAHYVVAFRRTLTPSQFVQRPDWLDAEVVQGRTVHVSGTLYRDRTQSPPQLHYAHVADSVGATQGQPIWPAIIEKAYAVAAGNNSYEGLNHGLPPIQVLRDVAGPSQVFDIAGLSRQAIIDKVRAFEQRPVVLSTHAGLPSASLPPGNHAVAVVDVVTDAGRPTQLIVFDAANNAQISFDLKGKGLAALRRTFDRLAQVRRPAEAGRP